MIEFLQTVPGAEQVRNLFIKSKVSPGEYIVIFKNSTRCATSRIALKAFKTDWHLSIPVYLVEVVENRPASNEVTLLSGLRHESPQVLVVRNGSVIHHASHSGINAQAVMRLINSEQ